MDYDDFIYSSLDHAFRDDADQRKRRENRERYEAQGGIGSKNSRDASALHDTRSSDILRKRARRYEPREEVLHIRKGQILPGNPTLRTSSEKQDNRCYRRLPSHSGEKRSTTVDPRSVHGQGSSRLLIPPGADKEKSTKRIELRPMYDKEKSRAARYRSEVLPRLQELDSMAFFEP